MLLHFKIFFGIQRILKQDFSAMIFPLQTPPIWTIKNKIKAKQNTLWTKACFLTCTQTFHFTSRAEFDLVSFQRILCTLE